MSPEGPWREVARHLAALHFRERKNWVRKFPFQAVGLTLFLILFTFPLAIVGASMRPNFVALDGPILVLGLLLAGASAAYFVPTAPLAVAERMLPHLPVSSRASHTATLLTAWGYLVGFAIWTGIFGFLVGGSALAGLQAAFFPFDLAGAFLVAVGFGTTLHGLASPRGREFTWLVRVLLLLWAAALPLGILLDWPIGPTSVVLLPFQALGLLAFAPVWGGPIVGAFAAILISTMVLALGYAPVRPGRMPGRTGREVRRQRTLERAATRQPMPVSAPMYRYEFDPLSVKPGPVPALRSLTKFPWGFLLYTFGLVLIFTAALITVLPVAARTPVPEVNMTPLQALSWAYLFGLLMVSTVFSVASSDISARWADRLRGAGKRIPSWRRPTPGASGVLGWELLQTLPFDRRMVSKATLEPALPPVAAALAAPPLLAWAAFPDSPLPALLVVGMMCVVLLLVGVVFAWAGEAKYYGPRESRPLGLYKGVLLGMWGSGMLFALLVGVPSLFVVTNARFTAIDVLAVGALVVGGLYATACALFWYRERFIVLTRPYDGASKFGGLTVGAVVLFVVPVSIIVSRIT